MTESGVRVEPGLEPVSFEVPVAGGRLHVARWGEGGQVVLGIHGVTASSMSLLPIARRLGPALMLVAPDLRGRGGSASLPGPYGLQAHAQDCAAVIETVAPGAVVVLGESMGAYVAVVLAAARPDLVQRLVLVDGGLPLPLPKELGENLDFDALVKATLGPAMARLSTVYPTRQAYVDFWKAHPALQQDWNTDIEAYLDYDLEPVEGGFRSRVKAEAVLADSREVAQPAVTAAALSGLRCGIALVRAPRDLLDRPFPLIPQLVVDEWQGRLPGLSAQLVEDVNHYTLMFGERGTATITALVDLATGSPA
jgi:pimeloyl-ACP methyl ester carboxylesterase